LASLLLVAHSVSGQKPGYDIKVQIEGIQDTTVLLGYHYGSQKYIRDTSEVSNGLVHFKGDEALDEGIYFLYTPNLFMEIIVKDQKFSIETSTEGLIENFKVKGSPENEIFRDFQAFMAIQQKKIRELNTQLEAAQSSQDSINIQKRQNDIGSETSQFKENLAKKHPQAFISKVIRMMDPIDIPNEDSLELKESYYYYIRHFWDNVDLTDESMLKTPVFHGKLIEFMDQATVPHPDSISKSADYVLDKSSSSPAMFRYILVTLANKYQTSEIMGMDAVFVHLAENYYMSGRADWIDSTFDAKIAEYVGDLKPNLIGRNAPAMYLLDTLLTRKSLYTIPSPYLVLYFYDPDCGHCKKKTPVLKEIYPDLKKLGAEVVAVNTNTNIKKWKNYIKRLNLGWINLGDPYRRSNFRKEYNIKSTPVIYILDGQKKIIAKKLGIEQIEGFIKRETARNSKVGLIIPPLSK